jgi:hypothetical protein
VSGAARHPGVYEIAFGTPVRDVLALAGGGGEIGGVQAVLAGGYFGSWLPGRRARRPADRHGLRVFAYAVGSERGYLVNPVLEFPDKEERDGEEGCLSFPSILHETDHLDGVLLINRMDAATRKLPMREIRASKWDMQMKMSRHRKTGPILSHPARATALAHRLRRKLQVTGPKCGYSLVAIPSTEVGGFLPGLSYAGGMQHVAKGAPWRTRS